MRKEEKYDKINNENLRTLKNEIYNQPLKEWQCDIIWEYICDYKSLGELKRIFKIK